MEIVIISDTHLKKNTGQLDILLAKFKGVDLMIHAGDYTEDWVLKYLQDNFNFIGVWGNNDDETIKSTLEEKLIVEIGPYTFGICHAHGKGKTTIERAYSYFEADSVDVIIFGHSHQPIISTKKKVLMLNPGSLINKRNERWYSYIHLKVDSKSLEANLIISEM